MQGSNEDTDIENRLVYTGVWEKEVVGRIEKGAPSIKELPSGKLPRRTGSPPRRPVMAWRGGVGGRLEREGIYVGIN